MIRELLKGTVAGAVGTVALNIATYADMAIRGRSSSSAPAQMVGTLARFVGLAPATQDGEKQDQTAQNRESGLGALLGYVNGLGTGVVYGLVRSQLEEVPIPLASIGVGLTAMAASDVPLIALRVSNPKTWGVSGWLSDVIPHLIYGLVTVSTYEALRHVD
jgi:hypothetical protein